MSKLLELKKCPFCGHEAYQYTGKDVNGQIIFGVECENCSANVSHSYTDLGDDYDAKFNECMLKITNEWNQRACNCKKSHKE